MSKVINGVLFGNIDSEELCRFDSLSGCSDKTDEGLEKATYEFLSKHMYPCTINGEDGICINEDKNKQFLKGAIGINDEVQVNYENKARINGTTLGVTRGHDVTVATNRDISAVNGTLGHELFHVYENERKEQINKQIDQINKEVDELRIRYTSITDQNEKKSIEKEMIRLYYEKNSLKEDLGKLSVKDHTTLSAHNSGKNMDSPYIAGLSIDKATRDVAIDKKLAKPRRVMGKDHCNKQLDRINKREDEINKQLSITNDPVERRKLENERKQLFQEKLYWKKQLMGLPPKPGASNNGQDANGNIPHKGTNGQTTGGGTTASAFLPGAASLSSSGAYRSSSADDNPHEQGGFSLGNGGPSVNASSESLGELMQVIKNEAAEFDKIKKSIEQDLKNTLGWWDDMKREEFVNYYNQNSAPKIAGVIGELMKTAGAVNKKREEIIKYKAVNY